MEIKLGLLTVVYFVTYIVFLGASKNLDNSGRRTTLSKIAQPLLLLTALVIFFDLSIASLSWVLLLGAVVGFTYPLIFAYYNRNVKEDICLNRDFAMGYYVSVIILCLEILSNSFCGPLLGALITTVVIVIFTMPAFFQWLYAFHYHCFIDFAMLQTLLYTHFHELKDLIVAHGWGQFIALIIGYSGLSYGVYKITYNTFPVRKLSFLEGLGVGLLLLLCLYLVFFRKGSLVQRCGLGKNVCNLLEYQKQLEKLKRRNSSLETMDLKSSWIENDLGTMIVVIGESANRNYMHAFGKYERENTPWLTQMAQKGLCTLFKNVYSSYVQTAQCLSMSLTNINQYNQLNFADSIDIVSVANRCGFSTYWYSNQGIAGVNNTPITDVAKKAKEYRWVLEDYPTVQYDEKLLDYLKKMKDTKENRLIFVHLKGSHMRFNCRYPDSFAKWEVKKGDYTGVDAYDNTIFYTDDILRRIFEYGKEHLNLQAMLYFSDHSTDIGVKRKSYFGGFEAVRVPMFLYFSEKYKETFSEVVENVLANKDKYFTNDCIFDLLIGVLGVNSKEKLKVEYDISGKEYNYEAKDLLTNLGRISLAEDKQE